MCNGKWVHCYMDDLVKFSNKLISLRFIMIGDWTVDSFNIIIIDKNRKKTEKREKMRQTMFIAN